LKITPWASPLDIIELQPSRLGPASPRKGEPDDRMKHVERARTRQRPPRCDAVGAQAAFGSAQSGAYPVEESRMLFLVKDDRAGRNRLLSAHDALVLLVLTMHTHHRIRFG
jgi:hypothetical protein